MKNLDISLWRKGKSYEILLRTERKKNIYYVGDKVRISNKEYIIDRIIIKTELIDNLDDISLVQRTKRKSLFFNTVIVKELKQYGEVFYEL